MSSPRIFQVILTLQAKDDLQDILQYTEETWGATQRKKYGKALRKGIKSLQRMPFLGYNSIALPEEYRILHIQKHLAVYKIEGDTVFILRVLHQIRDIERHL